MKAVVYEATRVERLDRGARRDLFAPQGSDRPPRLPRTFPRQLVGASDSR
jgi:hypothetical protein